MALSEFTKDMEIISKLSDEPNLDGGAGHPTGYTAEELKAIFDEGGIALKTYINNILVPYVNGENIDTAQLVGGSVTTGKIADGAVTSAKIGAKEVKNVNIDDAAVDTLQLANGSVTTPKIADGGVTTDKLDDSAVTGAKIASGAVTGGKIASNAVTTEKINDKAVTKAKLDDSVQASLDKADSAYQKPVGGIPKTDLATAVQTSLGKADSAYQKPVGGVPTADVADGAVTTAKLAAEAVTNAKLAQNAVGNYNIAPGAVSRSNLAEDAFDVFWAEYGTTYPVEIAGAIDIGHLPVCLYNNRVHVHVKYVPDPPGDRLSKHYFSSLDSDGKMYYLVCEIVSDTLTWSNGSIDLTSGGGGGSTIEPYTSTPAALGTASAGSSDKYARGDHVHKKPTAAELGVVSTTQGIANVDKVLMVQDTGKVGLTDIPTKYAQPTNQFPQDLGISAPGASTYYSRADHSHAMPSASDVGAIQAPSSANTGDFLCWNGTAWVATTVPSASGVSF